MRMRATRTSATGCNARKRALTIGQLLPAGAGRVAAIYTDPERPSYDECIRQNRKALGPERVVGGWITPAGNVNTTTQVSQNSFIATPTDGATTSRAAAPLLTGLTPGRTVWVMARLVTPPTLGSVQAYAREGATPGAGAVLGNSGALTTAGWLFFSFIATFASCNLLFTSSLNNQTFAVDNISVMEIADWSQIVLTDDLNATVPIFSVLQPQRGRGWLMDRSFGMVRGPELFDGNHSTGWGFGAGISGSADKITFVSAATTESCTRPILAISKTYEVRFRVQAYVSGQVRVIASSGQSGPAVAANGTYTQKISTTGVAGNIGFQPITSSFTGEVVLESVKELPGNHLSQPTAAARGEFSARYNLLNSSEDFTSGSWTKVAPSAATNANTLSFPNTSQAIVQLTTAPATVGVSAVFSVELSGVPGQTITIGISRAGAGTYEQTLQRVTLSATPTRYSVSHTIVGANQTGFIAIITRVDAGDTATTVTASKADLRLGVDAIPGVPAYQRVTSAADYDDVGFPVYHRQQTDDWAKTRINPNGATKMFALAAVQKMTEVGTAILIESSPITDTNAGSFRLVAPALGGGQEVAFASRGAGLSDGVAAVCFFSGATAFDAPARLVTTGEADIPNRVSRLTVNGATASSNLDQGTGPYLVHDVHFGSRGGTSLFENTRQFAPPLILFCQPADTINPSHVARLQKAYAKAAGVQI